MCECMLVFSKAWNCLCLIMKPQNSWNVIHWSRICGHQLSHPRNMSFRFGKNDLSVYTYVIENHRKKRNNWINVNDWLVDSGFGGGMNLSDDEMVFCEKIYRRKPGDHLCTVSKWISIQKQIEGEHTMTKRSRRKWFRIVVILILYRNMYIQIGYD